MNTTEAKIREIANKLYEAGVNAGMHNTVMQDMAEVAPKTYSSYKPANEAVQQLRGLLVNAKLEELKNINWIDGDGGFYFVKDRISALQQTRQEESQDKPPTVAEKDI